MYLNNEAQQWWYFLVSTIAITIKIASILLAVWRSYFLNGDKQLPWYYLGLASALNSAVAVAAFSMNGSSLPLSWYWCSMNDDESHQWYWLRCAIAETCTVGSSILALWRWDFTDHDQQQLWDYLILAIAIVFTNGSWALLCWYYIIVS